jgi:hypothetical protein
VLIRAAPGGAERAEVIMKVSAWAAPAAAIGLAAALAGCAGSASTAASANSPAARASGSPASSSPASSSPASSAPAAAAVPAGYRRISDPAQGIAFAVPRSWAVVNLAQESVQRAVQRINVQGISAQTLIKDMQTLQKLHALFVFDLKSVADSPEHFATNLDAYCISSGVTDTGTAGLPLLRQESLAAVQQIHAGHVAQKDVMVGGIPGLRTSYTLSTAAGTLEGQQLEVEPKPDRACFVTLTAPARQFPNTVLPVVAATTVFS